MDSIYQTKPIKCETKHVTKTERQELNLSTAALFGFGITYLLLFDIIDTARSGPSVVLFALLSVKSSAGLSSKKRWIVLLQHFKCVCNQFLYIMFLLSFSQFRLWRLASFWVAV